MERNAFGMMITPTKETIERLWRGSIDMHIHPAPDASTMRNMDTLDIAVAAQNAGMAGIVVKSFFYSTTPVALAAVHVAPEIKVFGSIVIGYVTTGGLDYAASVIENDAKLGCKVVWFPAFDARFCKNALGQEGGICILDENGSLKAEIYDILDVIKKYNMVLCSGHMSFEETYALFKEAQKRGITKLIATHPLVNSWAPYTMEQICEVVSTGAYVEHCYIVTTPRNRSLDPLRFVEVVKKIGAEHCIMSTDLCQVVDPVPAEGMRLFIAMMLQFGCTEREVEFMVQANPRKLLDMD